MSTKEIMQGINRLLFHERLNAIKKALNTHSASVDEQMENASKVLLSDYKKDKNLTAFTSIDLDIFNRAYVQKIIFLFLVSMGACLAQVPTANFSISPNPVCFGSTVQVTDLSNGSPFAWSYTIVGSSTSSVVTSQNPNFLMYSGNSITITLISTNAFGNSLPVVQILTVNPTPATVINPTAAITCPGGPAIMLYVNNPGNTMLTYSWSTGATTGTVFVSPSVTTVYSCVITNTYGCSIIRTNTVNSFIPALSITAIPKTICLNGTSTITGTGSGPSPYTYSWTTGANTRTISTNVPGVYTLTFSASNGCSTIQSYTMGVSNSLSLGVQASSIVICAGNVSFLSATGANNYTWSTGSTNSQTPVSPSVSTTYSIFGTSNTCTGSAFITVGVNNSPTLSSVGSTGAVCIGKSATLTVSGPASFSWSTGSTSSLVIVSPTSTTTYSLTGTGVICPGSTAAITISVNPIPTLTIVSSKTVMCEGEKTSLLASGANSYTWSGGQNTPGITIGSGSPTSYTAKGKDSNGCEGFAVHQQSVVACAGIGGEVENLNLMMIYPNPAREVVIRAEGQIEITLVDVNGKILKEFTLLQREEVRLSNLLPGLYYFIVRAGEIVVTKQVVIID